MQEKDTAQLENELTDAKDVKDYLAVNEDELTHYTLATYLQFLLEQKHLTKKKVIAKSELGTYAYHIFDGKKNAGRNKVLALALAMQLNVKEAQHLLYYAGAAPLYARNTWDSAVLFALQKHASVNETNTMLEQLGEPPVVEIG